MSEDNRSVPSYKLEAICRRCPSFDSWNFNGRPWHASHLNPHWSTRQKSDDLSKWTSYDRKWVRAVHFRTLHASKWKSCSPSLSGNFQGLRNARWPRYLGSRQARHLYPVHLQGMYGLLWHNWKRQTWLLRDAALPREGSSNSEVSPCRRDHF